MEEKENFSDNFGKIVTLKTDKTPGKRNQFGLCSYGNNIYIYGGFGGRNKCYDDLWHLKGILYVDILYVLMCVIICIE